jgi:REP element-mobilizing transposase RayT
MSLTIFTTWTTYGSWLPGDQRCWFKSGAGVQLPSERIRRFAERLMVDPAYILGASQRLMVQATIRENCQHRGWELHAVNCRSNHVHVVVTADVKEIETPRETFKAWCTRKLKAKTPKQMNWWTERGWDVFIDTQKELDEVATYILERQEE